jgi:hypothetical protein
LPYEGNPRRISKEAVAGVAASIQEFGWQQPLVVEKAGTIIVGHTRFEAAKLLNLTHVPVIVAAALSPSQIRAYRIADNRSGEKAEWDLPLLNLELEQLRAEEFDVSLTGFDLTMDLPKPGSGKAVDDNLDFFEPPKQGRDDVPDAVWPSDNRWGIPLLDIAQQATQIDLPLHKWGTYARTARNMAGTVHFYTDDYKFTALWEDPTPVINGGYVNACEPNYSINVQMPAAVALYRIYQKRWIARYWQAYGVHVIADLHVGGQHRELNALGIPQGYAAFCTRSYESDGMVEELETDYAQAVSIRGGEDLQFLVVGGGNLTAEVCAKHAWVHVREFRNDMKANLAAAYPAKEEADGQE